MLEAVHSKRSRYFLAVGFFLQPKLLYFTLCAFPPTREVCWTRCCPGEGNLDSGCLLLYEGSDFTPHQKHNLYQSKHSAISFILSPFYFLFIISYLIKVLSPLRIVGLKPIQIELGGLLSVPHSLTHNKVERHFPLEICHFELFQGIY